MDMNIGPSDWEVEGRAPARHVHVTSFRIDAFEATVGKWTCSRCVDRFARERAAGDTARAAYGIPYDEAVAFCESRGGRLPTVNEWMAAAAGADSHRYPWGESGAVCRRAAYGLLDGPCGRGGTGPDTVGSRPEGATASKIFDLAGNVAEWTQEGAVKGGSFASTLATELRVWSETRPASAPQAAGPDVRIGVRCVYSP
jgi:formylglycine-generating enzyme required for sulfatase activity